jgi:hypothetical protein
MTVREYLSQQTSNLSDQNKIAYGYRLTRNVIIHEIVGWPPRATISGSTVANVLYSNWTHRRNHTRDWINNYYTIHNKLPTGTHNLGNPYFPAVTTTGASRVNFDDITKLLYHDMDMKDIVDYPEWVRKEV